MSINIDPPYVTNNQITSYNKWSSKDIACFRLLSDEIESSNSWTLAVSVVSILKEAVCRRKQVFSRIQGRKWSYCNTSKIRVSRDSPPKYCRAFVFIQIAAWRNSLCGHLKQFIWKQTLGNILGVNPYNSHSFC